MRKSEEVSPGVRAGRWEEGGAFARESDDGVHRGWTEWHMQCLLGNSLGHGGQCGPL